MNIRGAQPRTIGGQAALRPEPLKAPGLSADSPRSLGPEAIFASGPFDSRSSSLCTALDRHSPPGPIRMRLFRPAYPASAGCKQGFPRFPQSRVNRRPSERTTPSSRSRFSSRIMALRSVAM